MLRKINIPLIIASGFGSGFSPKAPGTAGSLACLLAWFALHNLLNVDYLFLNITFFLLITILGFFSTKKILANSTSKDPQFIVIDEWAGLSLALLPLNSNNYFLALLAFALFRIFDVTKPWLIRKAENLPGAYGVMADDLLAGVISLLLITPATLL